MSLGGRANVNPGTGIWIPDSTTFIDTTVDYMGFGLLLLW